MAPPARRKSTSKSHSRSGSRSQLFSSQHNQPELPLHADDHRFKSSSKLARFARSRLVIGSLLLCSLIALTLASYTSLRIGVQFKYLANIFSPLPARVQLPLSLNPTKGRPITLSSMAPPQYRKPPQAPPVFTATPESLLADTRRLVS
jgi:hypothetical protein